jgi:predicted dienelactone hydrolase
VKQTFNKKLRAISLFLSGLSMSLLLATPLPAAEKIYFSYDPLMLSVQVDSLTEFAQTGTVNKDLSFYLNLVTPEQQKAFREALNKSIEIDPVLVSRFFNTQIGEEVLTRLGKGITIQGGSNGKYALRGAIVQAAFEPGGLSLLKVIQKLPTNIQIQGQLVAGFAKEADLVIEATETLVKEMRSLTAQEAKNDPPANYAELPDLRQKGSYSVNKVVWNLVDQSRDRAMYVDVFIPQVAADSKIPVIVFSHGLSSRPEDYEQGLQHIASYGYLVIAPQHPGSDIIYLKEMFEGYHRNIFDIQEFINRPKDISFVLDELERRNSTEFNNRLVLDNVGMAGHSFGGYTTLAIAGATIDFDNLKQDCDRLYSGIDISNLLECRALELPRQAYNFRDERVKAVFAANPVNRSIFGKKGLGNVKTPVLLASGSYDPAAPAALEQTASFTFLTVPDKYWMLVEGQAHVNFTKLDAGMQEAIDTTVKFALPKQDLLYSYTFATSVAFFESFIRDNGQNRDRFRPYLQSSYAEYLSQGQEFKLSWISGASSQKLVQIIEDFKAKHGRN